MTESTKLLDTFSSKPLSSHPPLWNTLYTESYHPWDRASPSLALSDTLSHRPDLIPLSQSHDSHHRPIRDATGAVIKHTALVPGCGLGHDVLLLAARGYDVWGVDASEKAIEGARRNEEEILKSLENGGGDGNAYAVPEGLERGRVHWLVADYFEKGWEKGLGTEGSGTFDLIFDYTFLCALPPSARPLWSRRTTDLLSHHAHSRLVCLEFPTGKPMSQQGPPWGVWPETYEALLSAPGEEVVYNEEDGTPKEIVLRPREDAVHRLCLIKPVRTHKAGTNEDGSVRDFVSVWSR